MGKPTGFLEFQRELAAKRSVEERRLDYNEVEMPTNDENSRTQAARCMDCGVPFCHNGCPLGNIIPEFNDAVWEQNWEYAYQILSSTNNFPEFTGRICPAPCESACVLGINKPPVAIEYIEKSIIERAYANGWVKPNIPKRRTGKKDGVIYLIDEVHTPDSSRYFIADSYQENLEKDLPQKQLSKEFVREWLIANNFQGKEGQTVPEMTDEKVTEISNRYIELYEKVVGEKFVINAADDVIGRIEGNIKAYFGI